MTGVEHFATVAHRLIDQLRPKETEMTTDQTATHILVITGEEKIDRDYAIECPGITDECRAYIGCDCPSGQLDADDEYALDEDPVAHGVEHKHCDGEWMKPTDQCFVSTFDQLPDAAEDLAKRADLGPGRYPIDFDYMGEGWYELQLLAA